jgi:hypothetical protein
VNASASEAANEGAAAKQRAALRALKREAKSLWSTPAKKTGRK